METKQVIVVRKDLNMRKGKIAAQVAHASMKVILDEMSIDVSNMGRTYYELKIYNDDPLLEWLGKLFTKIVVGCNSEEELLELKSQADKIKIRNSIIQDSGLTEFHGVPTYTVLAIGPDDSEKIDKITGHLKLL